MATAYHARQPSHGAAVDDTPTRPSSAAASFSSNLTSLKPPRTAAHGTKPSLSGLTSRAGAGLAAVDSNRLDARGTAPRPNSRNSALKASDLDGLADGADPHYIEADNTELARRRAEASFQREMQDLRNAAISPSSASDISLGPKQKNNNNNSRESDTHLRRQFDDETASSHSRTSASSYESFRIGLAAAPQLAATGESNSRRYQNHHDDGDDDDDLTYVTLARTDMTSPAKTATPARPSPVPATAPAPTLRANTATAAPATTLFASPRPFVTTASAGATLPAARVGSNRSFPQASSPRPAPAQTNENQPPPHSSSYANRPSPAVKSFPAAAAPSQPLRASPFSTVNPALSSFRTAGPPPPLAGTPQSAMPHRPSPLGRNSPILAASPTATSTPTGGSRSYISRGGAPMSAAGAGDRTTMTALPDRTGITDFLRSPERERQIYERERQRSATAAEERGRSSPAQPLGASTKTAESNLAAQALASLTSKLAALERDNANSAARVAELEARLAATTAERAMERGRGQSDDRQLEEEARRVRREVEILLGDERARREDLERVVASLRAQNAHLDATLSAQKQTLDALRVSRTSAPAPAAARNPQPEPYALRSEVQDLKHALAALGYEVDGVRTVVEELLREKEERDAGKKWEAEEAERRADLQAQAQTQARQPFASDDSIGTTPPHDHHDAQVEDSVRSWISQEEVEMLKREQREEAERQRRGIATTTIKPTAPRAHVKHDFSIRSSQDPTYVPSATASSAEPSEASYVSVTSATTDSFSSSSSAAVDEPDFARAERIFASAPPAAHRARRRSSSRQQQPRRASSEHAPGSKRRVDRVVLVGEPSANLCTNCHGRKETLKRTSRPSSGSGSKVAAAPRARDDGAEADEEDLAPVDEARERRKREHKAEKVRREQERVEREARKERERKVREREEHRRTLEDVLDRLEEEFSVQKKIYLELTAEYQSMSSRAQTAKRRALATHLKKSIDVLEDKARDVKRYADALEDMYEAVHDKTCPQRKLHGIV
ncbi:hypothetical protein RHOSPDRAFT_31246 [Rhodotorula sp. JG-1b]|nr:hypothetical protein RHOSPDRAFT_31246 [Rhodotorula sp. JG-1b]